DACEWRRGGAVELEPRFFAASKVSKTGSGDHRRIVGRQRQAWNKCGHLPSVAVRLEIRPQSTVRRNSTRNTDAPRPPAPGGVESTLDQRRHDDALKAGTEVGDFLLTTIRTTFLSLQTSLALDPRTRGSALSYDSTVHNFLAPPPYVTQDCRFEAAETEV